MRFRKMSMVITVITMMVMLLSTTTYAHPGRTDGKGGHWDHYTDKYHYHHGKSEHDHYDINGDGFIDCPYDIPGSSKRIPDDYVDTSWTARIVNFLAKAVPLTLFALILILFCMSRYRKHQQAREAEEKAKKEREEYEKKRIYYTQRYKSISLSSLLRSGCTVGEDGLPRSAGEGKWGEVFTVYVSSTRYHKKSCHYAAGLRPANTHNVRKNRKLLPCSFCHPYLSNTDWVDEYVKVKSIKELYKIDEPS